MAQHINNIFDNIDNWWENENVKKIKNDFCQKYAKAPPENHLSILADKFSREEFINGKKLKKI